MQFEIMSYNGSLEDNDIVAILNQVFVKEGYTENQRAKKIFVPFELQKRGRIKLAKLSNGKIVGMAIFVPATSPERQVANNNECEIHLLAVYPRYRGYGIASHLIFACEREGISFGYLKLVLSTQRNMHAAHHLYKKNGYVQNSKRNWTDGNKHYIVYEKPLRI